ncbi:rbcl rna s1-binding domain protein1 [Zea mays]|uniref:Rbcl rna s1-binding domain protein1 n=1 Tax=Zea mays TaxID=4577 RepID=A0A1D6NKY4_MAIZE|nr:rbcl rna s1-binding domain protein1 [Zea mays]
MPTPAPALPFVPKPQPILHVAKALVPSPRQTQPQARGRGLPQPVNCANSKRLDDALSAGFVRLLNAGQVQDADSASGTCRRYDPKPGDFAVGVVVSGTEARLDVAVGADRLATLLSKELLPLDRDSSDPPTRQALPRLGSIGVVAGPSVDDDRQKRGSRTLVAPGTVVFAEVLGRTLSGRPLLSARRLFRRLAWHRARQVEFCNSTSQLRPTSLQGLRAFLPKFELVDRISSFTDLKNKVGCSIRVCIARLDEETNDLIISEKKAWEMTYLKEGTLLQGTVCKIFPYGARVRIAGTNRSGLLHISNISRGNVLSVSDILKIDDEVKVIVIKSNVPDKIAVSIADLESAPGLFLSDREKVFSEAEEMAKRYREQLPVTPQNPILDDGLPGEKLPFDNETKLYANWQWFKFLHHS